MQVTSFYPVLCTDQVAATRDFYVGLFGFEVVFDAEYQRLVTDGGHTPVLPLRSEDFGQRHFIIADPAGSLIDVITEIPPSEPYRDHFARPQAASAATST